MENNTTQWWRLTSEEIFKQLGTTDRGLSEAVSLERLRVYGFNELPQGKTETWLELFLRQFDSPLLYVLMVAAAIAFLLGEHIDGGVIVGVLLLNGVVGTFQEGKAQKALQALKKYTETKTVVSRDGIPTEIWSRELVPGDIIELYPGDKVPADARLILAESMRMNEAVLTGESLPIDKQIEKIDSSDVVTSDQRNMVFRGTFVADGVGRAVVVATGIRTMIGMISQSIVGVDTNIPLKKNIEALSRIVIIGTIGLIIALVVFGLVVGYTWTEMLLMASSLLVSVIPEGLPVVMTLVLALGVHRMAKRNALVKKMQAVEGLAHTTVIGVDKTGTITRNELMVEEVFVDNHIYTVTGQGYIPQGEILFEGKPAVVAHEIGFDYAAYLAALSADASFMKKGDTYSISGDPTEGSLLVLGEKIGYSKEVILKESPLLYEVPFNTKNKYYINVHKIDGKNAMIVAGAPEVVTEFCTSVWHAEGSAALTIENRQAIFQEVERMAKTGLRVVMLAVKTDNVTPEKNSNALEQLSIVALFGMRDGLRAEVHDAVIKTKQAGIRVVMITGDHQATAAALAERAGIYVAGDRVMTGHEMDRMSDDELVTGLENVSVFARVTPEHKMRIIEAYKRRGDIIAMTGDGVNDVPPLIAAHLGLAMGRIGTEVTKEAAEIVLLDDNFATITAAIEEGRHIFNTLKKVIVYLFSTNLAELLLIMIAMLLILPVPLSPTQIIWINLVTDTFLVLALAFEPMEKNILARPFHKPSKYIISRMGFVRLILFGFIIAIGTFGVFYVYRADIDLARTMVLVTLGFFELFRLWSIRTDRSSCFTENPFRAPWLLAGSLLVLGLQIGIIYLPFMQNIFGTVELSLRQWGIAALVAFSVIIVDELRKLILRLHHHSS